MAALLLILLAVLLGPGVTGLQVTPNSPCSSFCLDSDDLDFSDPKSSNTLNQDITCYDSEYTTSPAGEKFQKCATCLQNSKFAQGDENDQAWFLYNLRYTFGHCIFGFPNASDVASTPCSTSTACGTLERALTADKLDATGLDPYGYCHAEDAAMMNTPIERCISCVSASEDQKYLANFLVALEAGCIQKPAIGTAVGLNNSVFSSNRIGAIELPASADDVDGKSSLATPVIAGIAVAAVVLIFGVAGILFIRCRRRRNRRLRLELLPRGINSSSGPLSPLSFRCQTRLSPRMPYDFASIADTTSALEKHREGPGLGSDPRRSPVIPRQSPRATDSSSGFGRHLCRGSGSAPVLHSITTSIPTMPDSVHYSTSPKAKSFSPADINTPASTTSTRSNSHVLPFRPYNPAEYGPSVSQLGAASLPDANSYRSPTSASTASPLLSSAWDQPNPSWEKPVLPSGVPKKGTTVKTLLGSGGKCQKGGKTGRPVESSEIQTSFPVPPPPPKY